MGAKTGISWCDSTWSPLRARVKSNAADIARAKGYTSLVNIAEKMAGHVGPHCEHASDGCTNCYSETNNERCLPANGTGLPFDRRSRDLVDIHLDEDMLTLPLRWKKPRRIFVNSQTDTFGEFVPDELIDRMFAVMALCPQHTFQVLSKRAERMLSYFSIDLMAVRIAELVMLYRFTKSFDSSYEFDARDADLEAWPLPNVWLGVSVEDQENANARIPPLLRTPAAVRFISYEPALGPIDLTRLSEGTLNALDGIDFDQLSGPKIDSLDWVIVGGESGPGARPLRVERVESLIDQCRDSGTPCFVKQLGSNPIWAGAKCSPIEPSRGKNADPTQWPESLRVQQFPEAAR